MLILIYADENWKARQSETSSCESHYHSLNNHFVEKLTRPSLPGPSKTNSRCRTASDSIYCEFRH